MWGEKVPESIAKFVDTECVASSMLLMQQNTRRFLSSVKPHCNSDFYTSKLQGICHQRSHPGCHNRDSQTQPPKVNLFSLLLNFRITLVTILPSPPSVACLHCLFPLSPVSAGTCRVMRCKKKQTGGWQACGSLIRNHSEHVQ